MNENLELIQILNTAIIKSQESRLERNYEERLNALCSSPALEAINRSISFLAENEKITRDQSARLIIEALRELDQIWSDYFTTEGVDKLKELLNQPPSNF